VVLSLDITAIPVGKIHVDIENGFEKKTAEEKAVDVPSVLVDLQRRAVAAVSLKHYTRSFKIKADTRCCLIDLGPARIVLVGSVMLRFTTSGFSKHPMWDDAGDFSWLL